MRKEYKGGDVPEYQGSGEWGRPNMGSQRRTLMEEGARAAAVQGRRTRSGGAAHHFSAFSSFLIFSPPARCPGNVSLGFSISTFVNFWVVWYREVNPTSPADPAFYTPACSLATILYSLLSVTDPAHESDFGARCGSRCCGFSLDCLRVGAPAWISGFSAFVK